MAQSKMIFCSCGGHCCHEKVKTKTIRSKNEKGFSFKFKRRTCVNCKERLGDDVITEKE